MSRFLNFFSQDLAIDLGTANTLIFERTEGAIILNEPSVVAVYVPNRYDQQRNLHPADAIVAVGNEAKQMLGRTPAHIEAIRPLRDGVIADFTYTEIMLKHFIRSVQSRRFYTRPRIIVSVPCESTQVEQRAIRETCLAAGAKAVYLLEEPMAVAIGMNLPVADPVGTMVVDIGGGTTEIGIISLGGLVVKSTLRFAGDTFDQRIADYISRKFNLQIGVPTAEKIKKQIGTAWKHSPKLLQEIRGRDLQGNMQKYVLDSIQIYDALEDSLNEIIDGVRITLERSPPELTVDILERGIILAGGGALLRDIDKRFSEALKIPTIIAEDPLTCVARGCGRALEQTELLQKVVAN